MFEARMSKFHCEFLKSTYLMLIYIRHFLSRMESDSIALSSQLAKHSRTSRFYKEKGLS